MRPMTAIRLDVHARTPVLDGHPFGDAGAYEKIVGTLTLAVDPAHPLHGAITDLQHAPRNAQGAVECRTDFYLLAPADPRAGNGTLLLDVPNRGRKMAVSLFHSTPRVNDPTTAADFGNGFLLRQGYSVVWCGWQHDVPREDGMMALTVPVARSAAPITGVVRCQFRPNAATDALPLADRYHVPTAAVDVDDPAAHLTVREHAGAPAVAVPRSEWRFARREGGRLVPHGGHVHLGSGFVPGRIYDLVYRAQDPPLVGLGLLAVRDTAAFLRFASAADGNPCAGALRRAYAFGISQSGRFLRHLLYLGLNEDEAGRQVFDGVIPHVAGARRGEFNMRWGQPSLNATDSVGSLFPFTDDEQIDPVSGARDGLLVRLRARGRVPKVVTINSSAEYWRGDASLIHTDVGGRQDVEPPPEVRIYHFSGTQHVPGAIPPPPADPNTGGRGAHPFNVVDYTPFLRAALVSLDRWVTAGVEPPPSVFPRLADGTAVPAEATAAVFQRIPGVRVPERVARPARLDFGPEWPRGIVTELPPKTGAAYPTFVSAVDADGNEVAGIRAIETIVPLATLTGWNPRHPEQGAPGDLMSMMGSTIPLAPSAAERLRRDDPRPSIAERYPTRADYLTRVRAAAESLVSARHLLPEDVDRIVGRAADLWDFILTHGGCSPTP
jgi:Alpha/beta hydrolase domain